MNEQKMFCWQCQETAGNKGCTVCGVCGKTADVAALQDELVYETKRLSQVTTALRKDGKPVDKDINHLVTVNLFITITNANFDADAIKAAIACFTDSPFSAFSRPPTRISALCAS